MQQTSISLQGATTKLKRSCDKIHNFSESHMKETKRIKELYIVIYNSGGGPMLTGLITFK